MVNRFDADETRKPQDTLVFIAMTHYLRGGYKHLLPMLKSICPSVLVDTHIDLSSNACQEGVQLENSKRTTRLSAFL